MTNSIQSATTNRTSTSSAATYPRQNVSASSSRKSSRSGKSSRKSLRSPKSVKRSTKKRSKSSKSSRKSSRSKKRKSSKRSNRSKPLPSHLRTELNRYRYNKVIELRLRDTVESITTPARSTASIAVGFNLIAIAFVVVLTTICFTYFPPESFVAVYSSHLLVQILFAFATIVLVWAPNATGTGIMVIFYICSTISHGVMSYQKYEKDFYVCVNGEQCFMWYVPVMKHLFYLHAGLTAIMISATLPLFVMLILVVKQRQLIVRAKQMNKDNTAKARMLRAEIKKFRRQERAKRMAAKRAKNSKKRMHYFDTKISGIPVDALVSRSSRCWEKTTDLSDASGNSIGSERKRRILNITSVDTSRSASEVSSSLNSSVSGSRTPRSSKIPKT